MSAVHFIFILHIYIYMLFNSSDSINRRLRDSHQVHNVGEETRQNLIGKIIYY